MIHRSSRFQPGVLRIAVLGGFAIPVLGCAQPKQQVASVLVRAESDPGVALAEVSLAAAGEKLGTTGRDGSLHLRLRGPLGDVVRLNVLCPSGYRAKTPELQVVLRPNEGSRPPEYRVRCSPERRTLVISLQAEHARNVPLRYLGKIIARTDEQGIAHALLQLPEGEQAKLVLDTSAREHRALRPQNPVLLVSVPQHDEVVSLKQQFALIRAPKPKPFVRQLPQAF